MERVASALCGEDDCFVIFCVLFLSRELNRRKHSKPGSVPVVEERKKHVVAVVK